MAVTQFKLVDETGKAKDVKGYVDTNPDGVYVFFHGDKLDGPRIAVQLFDGKLEVLVFENSREEEPTHQVFLDLPVAGPKEWRPKRR